MAQLLPFRDINVHASATHYAFASPSTPAAPTLVVERPTGDIRLNDGALLGTQRVSSIAGILGMLQLKLDKYIIVVTKAQPIGRLKGHMVYKVIATEFLPLRERSLHDADEDTYYSLVKQVLKTGPMFFSYSLDLTNSFQRQAQSDPSLPMWQRADDRFFYNRFLQADLINFRLGAAAGPRQTGRPQPGVDPFILPMIFGVLEIHQTRLNSRPFTLAIISRRSRYRGGTRYLTRGIDDSGHVANFNETEQVVVLNDSSAGRGSIASSGRGPESTQSEKAGNDVQVLAYVQTRGSVPAFWTEVSTLRYTPNLQVRAASSAEQAARKHLEEQVRIYGSNYLVNLVNQKGREDRVKRVYEEVFQLLVSGPSSQNLADPRSPEKLHTLDPTQKRSLLDHLHYIYFDFHNETKGLRFDRALTLLKQLEPGLVAGGYFRGIDMPGREDRMETPATQRSVVRTNCMDCLDRTGVVQSMIARWTLERQLVDVGILRAGQTLDSDPAFTNLFRNLWADNADAVSMAYAGSGALKTDFTRTGHRSKWGALEDGRRSLTRYVCNNFRDGPRQDGFDLFLGVYRPAAATGGGPSSLFADRRPLAIQTIPYLLMASLFLVLVAALTRRLPDATVWPVRLFTIFWTLIGLWSWHFIVAHGMLYVNWPKLNTPRFAIEGYQDALAKARHDPIVGTFVARHDRGTTMSRISQVEEGKKRIQ